jgi:hypothetical protein
MRMRWKLLGLAGAAGVAATGAVVAAKKRDQVEYAPEELRAKLHERLGRTQNGNGPAAESGDPLRAD